jgi:hypothetical protein
MIDGLLVIVEEEKKLKLRRKDRLRIDNADIVRIATPND